MAPTPWMRSPGDALKVPMSRRSLIQSLLCLATLPAWLSGCDEPSKNSSPALSEARSIRIGVDLWPGYYPLLLAQDLGYLEGIDLEVVLPENTQTLLSGFLARQFDGVCVSLGDIVVLTQTTPGVRMVFASDESNGGDVLFAREPVQDASQLHGARVATNLVGFGELFVRKYLERVGANPVDVTWVQADASEIGGLLQSKRIDIGHTWEPYASQLRDAGLTEVFSSAETPGLIPDGLVVQDDLVSQQRDELSRIIEAWLHAQKWWEEHPDEGNRRILKHLNGRQDLASLERSQRGIRFLDAAENRRRFNNRDASDSFYNVASQYVELLVDKGGLSTRPDLDVLLDGSLIP